MIELRAYQGLIRNHVQLADELGVDVDGSRVANARRGF